MSYQDSNIGKIFFRKYECEKKIGKGSFGTVYAGTDITTREKVAIKTEKKRNNNYGILETEAYRLIYLQGDGVPKIICYGSNQTNNILIQELLDRSLEDLFNSMKKKFSLKTVCVLGIEMIKRIQYVHFKHHIHRDIKPDNFMLGRGENDNKVYIIDFGLSKKYFSTTKHQHIKFCTGKSLIGTARYCAKNAHRGYEQSRRDDIESIGYVLMYFLLGSLPWQGLKIKQGEDQFEKIAEKKYNTSFEELCKGQPHEFLLYFKHVDQLNFEDEPNYEYLIGLFQEIINKYCNDCFYDFDWKKGSCNYYSTEQENKNKSRGVSLIVNKNGLSTNDESRNLPENNEEGKNIYNMNTNINDYDSLKKEIPPKNNIDDNLIDQNEVNCDNNSKLKRKKTKPKSESFPENNETDCSNGKNEEKVTKRATNANSNLNNKSSRRRRISRSIQERKSSTNASENSKINQKGMNSEIPMKMGEGFHNKKSIPSKHRKQSLKHKEKIINEFPIEGIQTSVKNESNNIYNSNNDYLIPKKESSDIIDMKNSDQVCNVDNINIEVNDNKNDNDKEKKLQFESIKETFQKQEEKPPLYSNRLKDINIVNENTTKHQNSRNKSKKSSKSESGKDSTRCSCVVF